MVKKLLVTTLILIGAFGFGQQSTTAIPGTKYAMIPPDGFTVATNFTGFQNDETGASIIVVDLPTSYSDLAKGFTKEALKTKGMDLISVENVSFNSKDATIYTVSQQANAITYLKQILLFGDKTKTVMVNGIYPEEAGDSAAAIRQSLFSITYNESQNENALEAATFSIDVSGTDYKFVKSMAGALLYSEDGKIPGDKGLIIVGNSLGNRITSERKAHAIDRLKKLPNADKAVVLSIEKIVVADLEGYEIVAEGNDKELIYQTMLYSPNNEYHLFVGETKENKEQSLNIYRKLARTFKLK